MKPIFKRYAEVYFALLYMNGDLGFVFSSTYQKVQVEEKWGHSEIKQAKVERLLDVVKINEENYKHENTYIKILERWSKKRFF
ncbi:DUF6241 domain-containing protein [Lysinibacillus contaminans]|uniref:DUF6241 domain-containing protein n=1 Tax=Lysinibacillus contaminans TaxID=1293441 RepID=UPI0006AE761E